MYENLSEMIAESKKIVFFGGAGVSTESGIPDFRSVDGLYHQQFQFPPETMLSHSFFLSETKEFYRFYREKLIYPQAKPNFAHEFLVELEEVGKLSAIVTQNIDNLHFQAGSKEVLELHGNVQRNYCSKCKKFMEVSEVLAQEIPLCPCGGLVKPDVVLYEEPLPKDIVHHAIKAIATCDMLIIAGTSLAVYPAASFVHHYTGKKLVVINKSTLDISCDLMIQAPVGEVFKEISTQNWKNH